MPLWVGAFLILVGGIGIGAVVGYDLVQQFECAPMFEPLVSEDYPPLPRFQIEAADPAYCAEVCPCAAGEGAVSK
jgi:hypothetical protein